MLECPMYSQETNERETPPRKDRAGCSWCEARMLTITSLCRRTFSTSDVQFPALIVVPIYWGLTGSPPVNNLSFHNKIPEKSPSGFGLFWVVRHVSFQMVTIYPQSHHALNCSTSINTWDLFLKYFCEKRKIVYKMQKKVKKTTKKQT